MKNTEQTKNILLEQLRKTPIIETCCQKVGITRMTLSRWRKADPDFARQVDEAILEGHFLDK